MAFPLQYSFSFISFFCLCSISATVGLNHEGGILLSLSQKLVLPQSVKSTWVSSDTTPCDWAGIACDDRGNVVNLNLTGMGVSGQLGIEVGGLSQLNHLILSDNNISGDIPSTIGNLGRLEYLELAWNGFSGSIPESFRNLSRLSNLSLHHNFLSGGIPESIFEIPKLVTLYLNNNNLTGLIPRNVGNMILVQDFRLSFNLLNGDIPDSIGNCTNLRRLFLNNNNLTGILPGSLANLRSLETLEVSTNNLEGSIPSELSMLRNLTILGLCFNKLTGQVPIGIWRIASLQEVSLTQNNLSGELPSAVAELKNLRVVRLLDNQFSGVIPQGLGVNSSLELVDFMNNQFTGEIPPKLCNGRKLFRLLLSGNQLRGGIPADVIQNCPSLVRLRLAKNKLTGPIPNFPRNSSLNFIELNDNKLNGSIPRNLVNCMNLSTLTLSMNQLTGLIPQELGDLVNLEVLDLSYNNLQGPIPPEISNCQKLFKVNFGYNQLSGSIPSNLANLTLLENLLLQENQLTGGIPDFLPQITNLMELRLGRNLLGGPIPKSFGQFQSLTTLDLSWNGLEGGILTLGSLPKLEILNISDNNLTGSITELGNLQSLIQVNVSYNSFTGQIPENLLNLPNSSRDEFLGNPGLCIACTSGDLHCKEEYNLISPCSTSTNSGKPYKRIHIILIAFGSVIAIGLFSLLIFFVCLETKRKMREEHMSSLLKQVMESTKNLSDKYIIGRGGHGVVYRACISPTRTYAVKYLNFAENKGAAKSMQRETEIVASIRHRNLVKLVDFWMRRNNGLILYEYMPNGSLHDVLHEIKPQPELPWNVRYRIALGTAQGLSYLHSDCRPPIVHRDIKPKNILLDDAMDARISDFGIANLIDLSAATPGHHSTAIIGTFGYMSPESTFSTRKTKASDVYSYGVVLLELLTRKQALDSSFEQNMNLVSWVSSTLQENYDVTSIADQGLLDEFSKYPNALEEAREVLCIATKCTAKVVLQRPSMRDIVNLLTDVKSRTGLT